jgi:hypothetical protein
LRPVDRMIGHTGYLLFARKFERAIIEDVPVEAPVASDDDLPDVG